MPKRASEGKEIGYLKGKFLTVAQLKDKYFIALTINNYEIMETLFKAEKPLSLKDVATELKIYSNRYKRGLLQRILRKLFLAGLVVRYQGRGKLFYVLSKKGAGTFKELSQTK